MIDLESYRFDLPQTCNKNKLETEKLFVFYSS